MHEHGNLLERPLNQKTYGGTPPPPHLLFSAFAAEGGVFQRFLALAVTLEALGCFLEALGSFWVVSGGSLVGFGSFFWELSGGLEDFFCIIYCV